MEKQKPLSSERNSPVRAAFSGITNGAARALLKVFPDITADAITYTGSGLVIAGSFIKGFPKEVIPYNASSWCGAGLLVIGVLCDALDGAVARNKKRPANYNELDGKLTDVVHNRIGEMFMAGSRNIAAGFRGDTLGVLAATISGLTAPLPSLLRAMVEKLGYFVPESGANIFSFWGTRSTRAALTIPATVIPETQILNTNIQPILDSISAAGNIASTIERYLILRKAIKGQLEVNPDEKAKEYGKVKVERLKSFTKYNTALVLGTGMIGLALSLRSN